MIVRIDHHSGIPVYRQLIDQIKLQIALGQLRPGDELPSTRALSSEIDLNPMTISKAYNLLEREGLLLRQRGKALTVSSPKEEGPKQTVEEAMRNALGEAASLAHRLELSEPQALQIFKQLLKETKR